MRDLRLLDQFRRRDFERQMYGIEGDFGNGVFVVSSPIDGGDLRVIASDGGGWDHVSVSRGNRCPNWPEMDHVKRLFFADDETAMQLHVPPSDHINHMPYCLHLWRPQDAEIPRPPAIFVAPLSDDPGPDDANDSGIPYRT